MKRLPLMPGEGKIPEDQINIPRAPHRIDDDYGRVLRRPPSIPVVQSYRDNIVRIWPQGRDAAAVDVVPAPGSQSAGPEQVFGEGCGPVYVIAGAHAFGRPTMFEEDFFGEIIAYAKERNITVKPLMNSYGHNTLIPRLLPELLQY